MLKYATRGNSRTTLQVNQIWFEIYKCLLIMTAEFKALYQNSG